MQKVLAIVGPTAVGKTELAIKLAKKLNGEIVSGDSMQVYQEVEKQQRFYDAIKCKINEDA